jgi:hypothetical protein
MRGGHFMNISHLVEKIKKGDNKSFEKLYKLTEREVWFTCISFLKNETTAGNLHNGFFKNPIFGKIITNQKLA